MRNQRNSVFKNLLSLFRKGHTFEDIYVYLDKEQVEFLYSEITGLQGIPKVEIESDGGKFQVSLAVLSSECNEAKSRQYDIPIHMVFKSIKQALKKNFLNANTRDNIDSCVKSYCWIQGKFKKTNFPDGNNKLEIYFSNIHCLILLNNEYVTSIYRPYLLSDTFSDFFVESLVYIPNNVKEQKYSNKTFGDDKNHEWVPIVPISITPIGESG